MRFVSVASNTQNESGWQNRVKSVLDSLSWGSARPSSFACLLLLSSSSSCSACTCPTAFPLASPASLPLRALQRTRRSLLPSWGTRGLPGCTWGCRGCWHWLVVYDDLRRVERFAELLLYIALVILYHGLLLDIAVIVIVVRLITRFYAIISSRDRFATVVILDAVVGCCFLGCCFGDDDGCVSANSLSSCSPISSSSFTVFCITRGVELSHLCQASFSAMIAASFFFYSSISCWLISNCCFFMR